MRWFLLLAALACLGWLAMVAGAVEPKPRPLAGWPIDLPDLGTYAVRPLAPEVDKDKKDEIYRQSFRYEWTGGDFRVLTVTFARDPGFKAKYAADAVKKAYPDAKEVKVGKKTGWILSADKKPVKMVVPLSEDKAILFETEGSPGEDFVTDVAGKLDLGAIETALGKPPRTDFTLKAETFKQLKKGMTSQQVERWVGLAGSSSGDPKAYVLDYKLADGSRALLGFEEGKLMSIKHEKDGKSEELLK
jgi:hypothetical protein